MKLTNLVLLGAGGYLLYKIVTGKKPVAAAPIPPEVPPEQPSEEPAPSSHWEEIAQYEDTGLGIPIPVG